MDKVTLLIDGDVVVYRATTAVEQDIRWDEDVHTLHSDPLEAQQNIKDQVNRWAKRFEADVVFAFSDKDNFRKTIFPAYKSNRKDKRKPLAYHDVKAWCEQTYRSFTRPSLEGDDVLGILSTNEKIIRGQKIIVSVDKDFGCIPGYYWNSDRDDKPRFISDEDADRFHALQTLTGDPTDGYPGCPGIGKVKAERLLDSTPVEDRWLAIVAAYEKQGLTEEDALVQARCARILRTTDYDFKKKEPILWTPCAGTAEAPAKTTA